MSLKVLFITILVIAALGQKGYGKTAFKTYWNMPTHQCRHNFNIRFDDLGKKYNIVQNENDKFRGDQISLLYNPGFYPAILGDGSLRNGGVPQKGNLTKHLKLFETSVNEMIPNSKFTDSCLAIIDFEDWRALFSQNFGTLSKYKTLSLNIVKEKFPSWTDQQIRNEAEKEFNYYARLFMEGTLQAGQRLRPDATWGYYGYPICFNNKVTGACGPSMQAENDAKAYSAKWLFSTSDVLNPSIYPSEGNFTYLLSAARGKVGEARRIVASLTDQKRHLVAPYYTLTYYYDVNKYIPRNELLETLEMLRNERVDGLVIWGSSSQVTSRNQCENLYKYVDTVFGPTLNKVVNVP